MPCDDRDQIERQVIADVLDTVEAQLRERELHGWRLTVPRSRIYAIVLHAVIVSARAAHRYPATLDRADILDAIFDGAEPCAPGSARRLVADVIGRHTVHAN
ncbi:hypothetical protein OHB26_38045 [Nocardia sp. NBC_01503]|uniref:hypothetical protein n=1 Tax=Nocardia sp. NBC_01503 TaxID=2975997 RepID=UPI002E7B8F54|nr:hypothetical protein [Nocardia sp. NBC_01503]WTL32584.1 hypothetical protein OHB26_38045 [Nocardia sp. NBC_01503]